LRGETSSARAGAVASHFMTCGSTAAAKAQPSAQDFAQSSLTASSALPASALHEPPLCAGSAFHAYRSTPWTRGTVIWLTMPLNAVARPPSEHSGVLRYKRSLPCCAYSSWILALTPAMVAGSVVVLHVPKSWQRFCARFQRRLPVLA